MSEDPATYEPGKIVVVPQQFSDDDIVDTGKTIEETMAEHKTLAQLRDDIVEAAVECCTEDGQIDDLKEIIDAYHKALRREHREGN